MSFDNLNAESRNFINARNAPTSHSSRIRCSYCNTVGHHLRVCPDPSFNEFETDCVNLYQTTNRNAERLFSYLIDYSMDNPRLISSYAVRYCSGATYRHTLYFQISHIIERIQLLVDIETNNETNRPETITQRGLPIETLFPAFSESIEITPETILQVMTLFLRPEDSAEIRNMRNLTVAIDNITRIISDAVPQPETQPKKYSIQRLIVPDTNTHNCNTECGICYENNDKKINIKLNCNHEFCKNCIKKYLQNVTTQEPSCPFCRTKIEIMTFASQEYCNELNDIIE